MSRVRLCCPSCGEIAKAVDEVVMRVCIDTDAADLLARCHGCDRMVTVSIDRKARRLLISAEVSVVAWQLPLELSERPHGLPPIDVAFVEESAAILCDDAMLAAELDSLAG